MSVLLHLATSPDLGPENFHNSKIMKLSPKGYGGLEISAEGYRENKKTTSELDAEKDDQYDQYIFFEFMHKGADKGRRRQYLKRRNIQLSRPTLSESILVLTSSLSSLLLGLLSTRIPLLKSSRVVDLVQ